MDRDEKELFMNLLDRLEAKEEEPEEEPTKTFGLNQKSGRPNIFNLSRTSLFGGQSAMMPDPHYFRKLLGVDF